jgi:dolichol-phosphate mannosyltransferase
MTTQDTDVRRPMVSVIVPAYNEEETVRELLTRLLDAPFDKEIVVVDDGSTDGTVQQVESLGSDRVRLVRRERHVGKGAAIRAGVPLARGQVIIIQDADLEYHPEDIPLVVEDILEGRETVVYGCRFTDGFPPGMAFPNRFINWLLAAMVRGLYGYPLHDEATCYKAFRSDILQRMDLTCKRFEFCPEVTAKVLRAGERIKEVPIRYSPRSRKAGRKIRWWDGVEAIWTLIKYRLKRRSDSMPR